MKLSSGGDVVVIFNILISNFFQFMGNFVTKDKLPRSNFLDFLFCFFLYGI